MLKISLLVEDLISLIETVAQSLSQGDVSLDLFNKMFSSLSIHGPQLEIYSKEILDRCFNVYRNASQDDRLKISIRLNLLNLIELRAKSWVLSDGLNTYYKQKAATNAEVSYTEMCDDKNTRNLTFFSLITTWCLEHQPL